MNGKVTTRGRIALWSMLALHGCATSDAARNDGRDADEHAQTAERAPPARAATQAWPSGGRDLSNTRSQVDEHTLGPDNAEKLGVKWVFKTEGDVHATASVDDASVYFPDAKGNLYALDRETGTLRWTRKIASYTGIADVVSRNTPTIAGDVLYLGDQGGRVGLGATVFAVDKRTGERLWARRVDDDPASVITMSPVVHGDRLYIGVSSVEEIFAAVVPGYPCCSFRGSMLALDRHTGDVVWKTYVVPGAEAKGYAGAALWGGTPVIDAARNAVYVTTGNNYKVPTAVLDCQSLPTPDQIETCAREVPGWEDNHFDAILALDLTTGAIKWAFHAARFDAFNVACMVASPGNEKNCTHPFGEDVDFGNGAILFSAQVGGRTRQLVGAGQKSGVFWALDPDDGQLAWSTQVGPGGFIGGLEWGSAYDGTRIYAAVSNSNAKPHTLMSGEQTHSGSWAALDPASGRILWQSRGTPVVKTSNQGPVSVANGVVYAGTIDAVGTMYALEAATGRTLWSFASGGSVNTSPAIVDGTLYWGSGYAVDGFGITGNDKFYAFAVGSDIAPTLRDAGAPGSSLDAATTPVRRDGGTPGWRDIFDAYLGPGTVGHCTNCHADMLTAEGAYGWLRRAGQIDGTRSPLAMPGRSRLTWFGGGMPPAGPTDLAEARRAIEAWVAAGAQDD